MNKKLIIALICLNLAAVLCWLGIQISSYAKKQQKLIENKKILVTNDVAMGILTRGASERLVDLRQQAEAGNQIPDNDLDWSISLFRTKWEGVEVKDSLARWGVLDLFQSMKKMNPNQRKKISDFGLNLYSTNNIELNSTRKCQFIRFGLATKDERFIPIVLQYTHDKDKVVQNGANRTLKYLGFPVIEKTVLTK